MPEGPRGADGRDPPAVCPRRLLTERRVATSCTCWGVFAVCVDATNQEGGERGPAARGSGADRGAPWLWCLVPDRAGRGPRRRAHGDIGGRWRASASFRGLLSVARRAALTHMPGRTWRGRERSRVGRLQCCCGLHLEPFSRRFPSVIIIVIFRCFSFTSALLRRVFLVLSAARGAVSRRRGGTFLGRHQQPKRAQARCHARCRGVRAVHGVEGCTRRGRGGCVAERGAPRGATTRCARTLTTPFTTAAPARASGGAAATRASSPSAPTCPAGGAARCAAPCGAGCTRR